MMTLKSLVHRKWYVCGSYAKLRTDIKVHSVLFGRQTVLGKSTYRNRLQAAGVRQILRMQFAKLAVLAASIEGYKHWAGRFFVYSRYQAQFVQ